jgi:hypothetical protein
MKKMKSLVKNKYYMLLIFAATGLITASCSDMNELSDRFLDKAAEVYAAKVDSVATHSGFNRIEIEIVVKTQRINVVKIFWSNDEKQAEIQIGNKPGIYKTIIENLPEDDYVFNIVSIDSYENKSLPVEVIGSVYGDNFQSSLLNRSLVNTVKVGNVMRIDWGSIDITNGAIYTEVVYTASDETEKKIQVPVSEKSTEIPDLKPGTSFKYRTAYLRDAFSIDMLTTDYKEFNGDSYLDKTSWSILAYSSQVNAAAANWAPNAIDGDYTNRWHSANVAYPHFMTIDFGDGVVVTVTRLEVWPTTNSMPAGTVDARFPTRVKFEVSMDNVVWTDLGEYDCNNVNTVLGPRIFNVTPTAARYYRFTGLASTPGNNYMVIGELDVYCK